MYTDVFVIAGERLGSRLLVGTGKFSAHTVMRDAVLATVGAVIGAVGVATFLALGSLVVNAAEHAI